MVKKTLKERMDEFVTYHRDGDGECNAIVLKAWADKNNLSAGDRFDLAYFFATTYCVESGIILYKNRDSIANEPEKTAELLKPRMIFQSDRRYVRIQSRFANMLKSWSKTVVKSNPSWWMDNSTLDLNRAISTVEKWYYFGRFAAFLFVETYSTLLGCKTTDTTIDWKNGDTATSGLLNLFGYDVEANVFDREGQLLLAPDKLDGLFSSVVFSAEKVGAETNTTKLETSLCAYRKFYKGSRYNGYYLDRMLEELRWYQKEKPEYAGITDELFAIRGRCFPHDMLGELHGWEGVRRENKKLYQEYGII